ncbi:hypothetical protein [Kibdelosporangium aridum]|uniref:hypothetical protein n=1 Tax=Kibdelosporangium aridum TaxID=2030 RepID=UPI0035E6E56E
MTRRWVVSISTLSFLAVGCAANENPPAAQPPATNSSSTSLTTSDTGQQSAPITAACPLLSNDDLTRLLNNGKDAKLTPTERKPEDDDGNKIYRCAYTRGGNTALELIAREFPATNGRSAASAIDSMSQAAKSKTTPVSGVGETAVFYETSDGTGVLLAGAKHSGDNVRLIALTGPKVLPQQKLTEVAAAVMARL